MLKKHNLQNFILFLSKYFTGQASEIIKEYSEGLAAICGVDGKWGFIDEDGNIVVELNYLSVTQFYQGIALVYSGGSSWKVINKIGNIIEEKSSHGLLSDHSYYEYEQGVLESVVTDTDRDPDREYWRETFIFNTGEKIWLGDGCSSYSGGGYDSYPKGYIPITTNLKND